MRVEFVLIGAGEPLFAIASHLSAILEADVVPDHPFPLPGGGWAVLDGEEFDSWSDDRLSGYRWQITVGGLADSPAAQQNAAAALYERVAAGTDWALALTFDHTDVLAATRSGRAREMR